MILPGYPDDGYDYEGWYTARDGGTRVGGAGDELDFSEHPDWFQDTYYAHGTLRPATPDPNAGKSSDVSVKTLTVTDSAGNVITPVKAADTLYDVYVSRDCTSVRLNVTPASDKAAVSFEDYACQDLQALQDRRSSCCPRPGNPAASAGCAPRRPGPSARS